MRSPISSWRRAPSERSETMDASVPIPKFASLCGTLVCELRNRRTLAKSLNLVWLWFRSPHEGLAERMMRTSEPPHWRGVGAFGRRQRLKARGPAEDISHGAFLHAEHGGLSLVAC